MAVEGASALALTASRTFGAPKAVALQAMHSFLCARFFLGGTVIDLGNKFFLVIF